MPWLIHQTFIDAHCEPGPPLALYLLRTQKRKISLGRNMEFPIIPLIMSLFSHSKNNIGGARAEISQGHSFILHTFVKHLLYGQAQALSFTECSLLHLSARDFQSQDPTVSRVRRGVSLGPSPELQCLPGQVVRRLLQG